MNIQSAVGCQTVVYGNNILTIHKVIKQCKELCKISLSQLQQLKYSIMIIDCILIPLIIMFLNR